MLPSSLVAKGNEMIQQNQSEVAHIKAQIEAEIQAAQWALYGASLGAAQHQFITCRMERMGILHEELKKLVGEEEGIRLLIQVMEIKSAANLPNNLVSPGTL
jgi:hypothetical protein